MAVSFVYIVHLLQERKLASTDTKKLINLTTGCASNKTGYSRRCDF